MNCNICRGACCESFSADIKMIPFIADAQRWLELHAMKDGDKLEFECRCTMLTSTGRCAIWKDRPLVCELYIAGSKQCLETVQRRRTKREYQKIRDESDPATLGD